MADTVMDAFPWRWPRSDVVQRFLGQTGSGLQLRPKRFEIILSFTRQRHPERLINHQNPSSAVRT